MLRGLVTGQVAAPNELGDEGVVLRDGLQLPAAQKVRSGVSDVRDLGYRLLPGSAETHRHHGGPHTLESRVSPGRGEDAAVGLPYGVFQRVRRPDVFEDVDRDGARDLPGFEATDAVGDHEEGFVATLADKEGVLVVLANLARVREAVVFEEQHALADPYSEYLKVVDPTRTRSPLLKGVAPTVLRSLTKVPLVEPASSTYKRPPWRVSLACCPET